MTALRRHLQGAEPDDMPPRRRSEQEELDVSREMTLHGPGYRGSIVVPAHNEAAVLAHRLGGLLASLPPGTVEVTVVANGCTDDTAAVARELPGVHVVELPVASKTAALNAGDREATSFPRIYLDGDIELSSEALTRLIAALTTERAVVAAPRVTFDVSRSSWPVRAFFAVFERLPYTRRGLIGLGVYGFSESARRRFDAFPAVVADDLYVQRLFSEEERCTVDATFGVAAPRTLSSLVAVRTRVARGNRELAARSAELGLAPHATAPDTVRQLAREVAAHPGLLPAALVYIGVTAVARARARRAASGVAWERDESSRPTATRNAPIRIMTDPAMDATSEGRP
jgi:hypothetical protein